MLDETKESITVPEYVVLLHDIVQKKHNSIPCTSKELIKSVSLSESNIEEKYLNTNKTNIPSWEKLTTEEIIEKAYSMLFDPTLEVKKPIYPSNNITSYDVPDPWNYIWTSDVAFTLLQLLPDSREDLINLLNTAKIRYITEGLCSTVLYRKEWTFEKDWTIIEMWAEKDNSHYVYCLSTCPDIEVYLTEEF